MIKSNSLIIFLIFTGITVCISQEDRTEENMAGPLTGQVTRDSLFKQFPAWQYELDDYSPDSLILDSLGRNLDIDVEIFLGTWCSDSEREVPRFFKILDETQFVQPQRVKLMAVDRSKKLASGLTEKRNIEYVATFIFFKKNKEIGRIVEQPETSLEADILKIIKMVK